jgi:hypothetical protein
MAKVIVVQSMSLDGFIAGSNDSGGHSRRSLWSQVGSRYREVRGLQAVEDEPHSH